MRVNKNVAHKERRQFSLDGFKGVDFASSPLSCDPRRSPDAVNFIGDHGINRKRHGWEQCVRTGYTNVRCIQQVSEDKIIEVTENKILTIKKNAYGEWDYVADNNGNTITIDIDNTKSVTPVSFNGKMFFIGTDVKNGEYIIDAESHGAYYYDYNTGVIKNIKDDGYYVPTTTIDIDTDGLADIRAPFELPNIVTTKRKNKLTGIDDSNRDWILDSAIRIETADDVYGTSISIVRTFKDSDGEYVRENIIGVAEGSSYDAYVELIADDDYTGITENDVIGTIYTDTPEKGQSLLNLDVKSESLSGNNITVTYTAKSDYVSINPYLGNIGCAFGIDGANDRLFLAGHPYHPNVIFFSEIDDPTYFPDQYTISVGSPNSKIVGMMRLNDGTMAVFKEPSESDVCLYYIKGSYRNEYDDAGNIKKILPVFSVSASPFYDAPISSHAALGFHGDSIFFSKNGIFAIEPEQNISADIRLARNRAAAVSPIFYNKKVVDATGIVHKNKCYFSYTLSDGSQGVLVADAAYKYVPEGELSYNYEWWYWEDVPAITFAIVDDVLWFGTAGGRICRFTDGYTDSIFNRNDAGAISLNGDKKTFSYNGVSVKKGRRVSFYTKTNIGDSTDATDITNKFFYLCNIKSSTFQLALTKEDAEKGGVDVAVTNIDALVDDEKVIMRFYQDTPVKARWSTPPLDFGSSSLLKSMRAMTVVAESGTNAKFKFGFETGNDSYERDMEGTGKFDLGNINFADFSFDSGFQNAFTVRAYAHNFNFIKFHIVSDEAAPCAVHRISAEYKFNKKNRGVN